MLVETNDKVGIGGFIITGASPKHVVLRALGPSLKAAGVTDPLADPVLELRDSNGVLRQRNDNWKDDPAQRALIEKDGLAPSNDFESAIDELILDPGSFTAIISGKNGTMGVGVIEIYDLDDSGGSKLANISTRAFAATGDNIVIAGFVLGQGTSEDRIAIRGIGPSLEKLGVENPLPDPKVEVHNASGTLLISNDDWQNNSAQAAELSDAGLAPAHPLESGLVAAFSPGSYTALLSDFKNKTGVGLIEVYDLGAPTSDSGDAMIMQQRGNREMTEKQQVTFGHVHVNGTFRIRVHKPSVINDSGIGARAALEGETQPIPFTASAKDIAAAITAIPHAYYAYGQFGNEELTRGSFSYFAAQGAINREPVITLDDDTAAGGFMIEFGSRVGSDPAYNTWVAGMPLIDISIP
jgi:hypothetical protein